MKLCGIIYKALLYFVPEITGVKCGKNKETRHNQFSVCEWQVFEIQMVGAESCKKRVTTEYRSSLL